LCVGSFALRHRPPCLKLPGLPGAAGQYANYYLQNLKKPECIVAPNLRIQRAINCNPPTYPLNGSSADTYNSTSFNDDLAWAAMWMYRCEQFPCADAGAPKHASAAILRHRRPRRSNSLGHWD